MKKEHQLNLFQVGPTAPRTWTYKTGWAPRYFEYLPLNRSQDYDDLPDDVSGERFLIMCMGDADPERMPRKAHKGGRQTDVAPHLTIAKTPAEDWHETIEATLIEHGPLTLNAIGVLSIDKTGDILGGSTFEQGLWQLVLARKVWTHLEDGPPIFFCHDDQITRED